MHLPTARLSATHSDLHRLRRSKDVDVVERGATCGARTCAWCRAARAARRVAWPRHTAWRSTSGGRCACHCGLLSTELPPDVLLLGELLFGELLPREPLLGPLLLSGLLLGELLLGELLLGELLLSELLLSELLLIGLLLGVRLAWERASASDCACARERVSAPRA